MPVRSAQRVSKTSKKKKSTRAQSKSKNLNRYIATATLFTASLVFFFGFYLYKQVDKHFASADSVTSEYGLSKNVSTLAYLRVKDLANKDLTLERLMFVFLDRASSKIVVFDLPLDY